MEQVHIQANFLPAIEKFKVQLKTKENTWVELMTKAKFFRFVRRPELVIGGMKVEFSGKGAVEAGVRAYLKQVAKSYAQAFHKKD